MLLQCRVLHQFTSSIAIVGTLVAGGSIVDDQTIGGGAGDLIGSGIFCTDAVLTGAGEPSQFLLTSFDSSDGYRSLKPLLRARMSG